MVSAEARGGLTVEYPQMRLGDNNITYTLGRYQGTPEELGSLPALAQSPKFLKLYPDHTVFVVGVKVLGALPNDPKLRQQKAYVAARHKLNEVWKERGITVENCAIIRTSSPVEPAPVPAFEAGVLFSAPAPTR